MPIVGRLCQTPFINFSNSDAVSVSIVSTGNGGLSGPSPKIKDSSISPTTGLKGASDLPAIVYLFARTHTKGVRVSEILQRSAYRVPLGSPFDVGY